MRPRVGGGGRCLQTCQRGLNLRAEIARALHPEVGALAGRKIGRLGPAQVGERHLDRTRGAKDVVSGSTFAGEGKIESVVLNERGGSDDKRQDQHEAESAFAHGQLL